jgi:hypothetical protein
MEAAVVLTKQRRMEERKHLWLNAVKQCCELEPKNGELPIRDGKRIDNE